MGEYLDKCFRAAVKSIEDEGVFSADQIDALKFTLWEIQTAIPDEGED